MLCKSTILILSIGRGHVINVGTILKLLDDIKWILERVLFLEFFNWILQWFNCVLPLSELCLKRFFSKLKRFYLLIQIVSLDLIFFQSFFISFLKIFKSLQYILFLVLYILLLSAKSFNNLLVLANGLLSLSSLVNYFVLYFLMFLNLTDESFYSK